MTDNNHLNRDISFQLNIPLIVNGIVTRSHKYNDRYNGEAASPDTEYFLPKYFGKAGFDGVDPKKTKKDGGGKGNW